MSFEQLSEHIREIIEDARVKLARIFKEEFPNLFFYVSPYNGDIACWVSTLSGRDGAAVKLDEKINIHRLHKQSYTYLEDLNRRVESAVFESDKYFYCTNCGKVLPREKYGDYVMAAQYCEECAKKPSIAFLIDESHKPGFYD